MTVQEQLPVDAPDENVTERTGRRRHSSRFWLAATGVTVALVAGIAFAAVSAQGDGSPSAVVPASAADSSGTTDGAVADGAVADDAAADDAGYGSAGGFQDPASPTDTVTRTDATATRVQIPAIGVDATLEQLALDPATSALTPPVEWLSAGWYRDGTVPGDIGPAVIAGHVDSVTKPAVFARLGELVEGDTITVTLSNSETRTFRVDSQTAAPKDAFPTDLVYGPTPTPQLRLITCDGVFNSATGHYLDNLIVFASLVT